MALLWAAAILVAPAAVGVARDLPYGVSLAAAATYATGRVVCHQRPERSVAIAGQPMPVCARCAGLYLAFPMAFLFWWRRRAGHEGLRTWLLACAIPTVLTVAIELATGATAAPVRALAGAVLAVGLARLLAAALAEPASRPAPPVLLH